jgi:hypothetical protein
VAVIVHVCGLCYMWTMLAMLLWHGRCCSLVASVAWTMWCLYGLNYAFTYACFYDTSIGHYTWYICNKLSAQTLHSLSATNSLSCSTVYAVADCFNACAERLANQETDYTRGTGQPHLNCSRQHKGASCLWGISERRCEHNYVSIIECVAQD